MKIAIYGGTGNVGRELVAEAVRRGHEVTALSRHEAAEPVPGAVYQRGDAADRDGVAAVAAGHDAVVSALGPSREPGGDPFAFAGIVGGMAAAVGGTRLVVVGGASTLLVAPGVRLLDTPEFPEHYKTEALASAEALELLRALPADVDWTYLSPAPEIGPGERTGAYRTADEHPAGDYISFADYAIALLDELERPAHRRARFTVASG
jgi:putative NADH-flavin reductase